MFLLYHSEVCNSCGGLFRKCYINDLHTTTCSGMLGHRNGSTVQRIGMVMARLIHVCYRYQDARVEVLVPNHFYLMHMPPLYYQDVDQKVQLRLAFLACFFRT
jgi:hypothetical protein